MKLNTDLISKVGIFSASAALGIYSTIKNEITRKTK